MAVITLTSDYGTKDHYVAALKGALHRELGQPQIVDVTHQIEAFNLVEAAFILRNAYHHFPEGSIHLLCVDEEALPGKAHLAISLNKHFFIAADNGILSMISPAYKPDQMVAIDLRNAPELTSARDIFARVAAHLARGGKIDLLGREIQEMKQSLLPQPVIRENGRYLIGSVIYVDRFGNLVSNLHQKQVAEVSKGRNLIISLSKGRKIRKILGHYYEEETDGKLIAIFNASGLLEIAIFKSGSDTLGGATDLLGMRLNDQVNIEFL
jgi:S-adenosylmethionine hydrolase